MEQLAPVTKKIVAFGSKQVFLPKFTIALIRTPNLSPYHAKFLVPLNFSKYDLRDYLYHAYSVKVHSIRSLVKQMPVRDTTKQPRHWFREESQKYMTVEMEKPFVWPETPESWEPWGRKEREESVRSSKAFQGVESPQDQRIAARTLRQQALELLGKNRWPARKRGPAENEDKKAAKKAAKSKQSAGLQRRWEARRTPQILSHEHLGADNFAGLLSKPGKQKEGTTVVTA